MIVLGAGGLTKQLIDILLQDSNLGRPVFFDDRTPLDSIDIRHEFEIIRSWDDLKIRFSIAPEFAVVTTDLAPDVTVSGMPAKRLNE